MRYSRPEHFSFLPCPDCGIRVQDSRDPDSRMVECYQCNKIFDPLKMVDWALYGRPPTLEGRVREWMRAAWFLLRLPYILILRLPYTLIVKLWKARHDIRTVKFLRPLSWRASTRNSIYGAGVGLAVVGAFAFIIWRSTWDN